MPEAVNLAVSFNVSFGFRIFSSSCTRTMLLAKLAVSSATYPTVLITV